MHQRTSSYASTSSSLHDHDHPESISSRSSSVDLSGSDYEYGLGDDDSYRASTSSGAAGTTTTGGRKKVPRPLRPLNREKETYLWNSKKGQLSRVSPGVAHEEILNDAEHGAELVTFPPGSCTFPVLFPFWAFLTLVEDIDYKVVEDELEILPCDNRNRVNTWLRGQSCVENCSFRFEGKRCVHLSLSCSFSA
jgi:hypothetical protein